MTATYQVKPSKYFKIYQFVVIFQYEPTFVLLDRGRCPRTLSEVWKIQLKTELSSAVSEGYIFQAEDNVRGRRPLYFIYPVSLNFVLLVMLQMLQMNSSRSRPRQLKEKAKEKPALRCLCQATRRSRFEYRRFFLGLMWGRVGRVGVLPFYQDILFHDFWAGCLYLYLYSVQFYDQHYLFSKRSLGFKNSSVIMFWAKICQKQLCVKSTFSMKKGYITVNTVNSMSMNTSYLQIKFRESEKQKDREETGPGLQLG